MQSSLNREYRKMYRNLNGIRKMNRLPECLVVIDPKKEKNAIREAKNLGITTCALIDSDCDPDDVDLPIPGNDDGIRSIEIILSHLADAVIAGAKNIKAKNEGADSPSEGETGAAASDKSAESTPDQDVAKEASAEASSDTPAEAKTEE